MRLTQNVRWRPPPLHFSEEHQKVGVHHTKPGEDSAVLHSYDVAEEGSYSEC